MPSYSEPILQPASRTVAVRTRRSRYVAGLAVLTLTVMLLLWAKWWPYAHKIPAVADSGNVGPSILTDVEAVGVSVAAGVSYAADYFAAIWPALVAGLLIAAAVEVALPDGWLLAALRRRGTRSALLGSALALPTLMCTCCAAPVTVGLRRRHVPVPTALVFFVANPVLNPVVLILCLLVLPWPWTMLRICAGLLIVGTLIAYAHRTPDRGRADVIAVDEPGSRPTDARDLPRRYLVTLRRLSVRLLPEYLLIVAALGALRGWLIPQEPDLATSAAAATVLALAVTGTLLPIPTAAEVAVISTLLSVGVSGAVASALLITLPAVSLPSLVMMRHVFPTKVLATLSGGVAAGGVLTALMAAMIGL